jgi:hypothetical protein
MNCDILAILLLVAFFIGLWVLMIVVEGGITGL